jgi:hypothetical protein
MMRYIYTILIPPPDLRRGIKMGPRARRPASSLPVIDRPLACIRYGYGYARRGTWAPVELFIDRRFVPRKRRIRNVERL